MVTNNLLYEKKYKPVNFCGKDTRYIGNIDEISVKSRR